MIKTTFGVIKHSIGMIKTTFGVIKHSIGNSRDNSWRAI